MATTTNYSWTTPDDTALVKDGAAAIRSLGTSIDTTTKNLNPSTTLGDIEYRSSTANTNTRLGIGSTGQVLTVAGGVPSWATAAGGGGKVLQVVMGSTSTMVNNATTTYVDTNLTATITPTSSTSKVLAIVSQNGCFRSTGNTANAMKLRLLRGASEIALITEDGMNTDTSFRQGEYSFGISYLDSPSTTSATTYKTQFRNAVGASSIQVQSYNPLSTLILMEIGA